MVANKITAGDIIGIISPCHIAKPDRYRPIIARLESLGFRVKTGANLYRDTYGFSASEQERADDFNQMVLDDEVKMIFFGGGNVGNEVLPYINFEDIIKHPKIICSYSDGTTLLNAIYAKTGLITYYGQAPGIFADLRHYDYTQFASHFIDGDAGTFVSNSKWETICGGACEGLLIGGYMLNFALLLGGRYFPYDTNQKVVLFLEDHESFSEPNAVSMFLSHIGQSDFMGQVTGLLFGHYSSSPRPELTDLLRRFGMRHHIPVASCDDFGHGVNHAILPIGRRACLDADRLMLRFC